MRRSSRLFEIIQLLRGASAPTTAQAIAEALEVNKRTIYRDIASLQAMRVPIEGEAGIGYVMRAGFDLPPLMFTADEIEAIVVGLSLLGRTSDTNLQTAAARIIGKLADVLPVGSDASLSGRSLQVSHWNAVPAASADYGMLRRAIREERKLRFLYRDAGAHDTERTICPIALLYYVDSAVLAAWCELRGDYRHFRVDRMQACYLTDMMFKSEGQRLRAGWPAPQGAFASA